MEEKEFFWLLDRRVVWVLFLLMYLQLRNIHSLFFSFEENFSMFLARKSGHNWQHSQYFIYFLYHDCKKTSCWYGESNESSWFLAKGVTRMTRKMVVVCYSSWCVCVSNVIELIFLWYHGMLLIQLQTLAEVEKTILYVFRSSSAYGKLLLEEEVFCSKKALQAKERASHQWLRDVVFLACWWYLALPQTLC